MEWEKIRKWMILLVLAVDLFLAGNLALHALSQRQLAYDAVQDAVAVARSRGVEISPEAVLRLPEAMTAYSGRRSPRLEGQAALSLLGEEAEEEVPGGGVAIYRTAAGEVSFRRGGTVEMALPWEAAQPDPQECLQLLEKAGFPVEGALASGQSGLAELIQYQDGYPILNSRLLATVEDGSLRLRGHWMAAEGMSKSGESLSQAQMVLALCDLLEQEKLPLVGLRAGYYLQSPDAQGLTLEPVWEADTGQGVLIVSCLTGKQLNF